GRRKSLILLAQSTAAAILWLLLFYFGVKSTKIDAALVKFVNLFMGENGVQEAIGVSEQATTFRSILTLYFESLAGEGFFGMLLSDSSAYVYTLADMAYHVAFATICYIFYLLTVFILYLIYLCFYSERKYKRKKMKKFSENNTDTPYKKHHVGGGFVGLARGIAVGILSISFIGAGFYMVAGGRGEGKIKDYEVSGKYEAPLKIYRSLESYGTQGIFLILNAMSDPADMPYYLFAADLVFSGELNDELNGVSEEVNLRGELGAFTGLARDTITLLLKYGSTDLSGAINGTSDKGIMQSVLGVMRDKGFQTEFDALIAEFDSPTYIHNFCMSLVSSLLANLDSTSFGGAVSPMNKEILKIMFKKGHLSEYIPEDIVLHDLNVQMKAEEPWLTTGRNVRSYIGLQQLVSKEDVRRFMKIFFTILTDKSEGVATFDMIRSVIPQVKELALFENGRSKTVDPVLARVYCYFQNAYLRAEGADSYSYNALLSEHVAWTDEIDNLLEVAEDFFVVRDDVKDAETAIFNRILYIFDKENPNREKDIALYDKIEEKVSASRLLGKTLSTSFFRKTLTDGLGALFDGFYVRGNTVYENAYAEDGSLEAYGEIHYFMKGLRLLGSEERKNEEDQTLFDLLFAEEEEEISTILSVVSKTMKLNNAEGNFAYFVSRSDLLRSVVSCFLIERGQDVVYVPKTVREKNEFGELVNVVMSDELEVALNGIDNLSSFVDDCVDGDYYAHIDEYLDSEKFMAYVGESRIAEGSLALLVKNKLCDGDSGLGGEEGGDAEDAGSVGGNSGRRHLIVPKRLADDVEYWCSTQSGGRGELKKFIASYLAVRNQAEADKTKEENGEEEKGYKLSLKNLMRGTKKQLLLTTVSNLGKGQGESDREKQIHDFLASDIIHYTVSDYLQSNAINNLSIVVPVSARDMLYKDVIDSVIKRDELFLVFLRVNQLNIKDNMDATELVKNLVINKDLIESGGEVLSASVVANIVNNGTLCSVLKLNDVTVGGRSDTYFGVGQKNYLENGYYPRNPWKEELPKLLAGLNALFKKQIDAGTFVFDSANLKAAAGSATPDDVGTCRQSQILRNILSTPSTGGSEEEGLEE
ncbi:MAG: hypothetical protein K2L02_05870, partial [Clostridia bacterium]|nr:hypothetical protein [Clostridia bacterium]